MTFPPANRILRLLLWIGLPCIFWFGFFANPHLVPETEVYRTPVGFIHYDIYRLYYPSLHAYFGVLGAGGLPLWDPFRAAGFPAMGSYLFGIFYPLNFPFLFLAVPTGLTLTCCLHFFLSIWGMFRFLRGLRLKAAPALLGGIVYTFSGFMVFSLWHPSLFNCVATAPLLFAVGDRWARKGGLHRAAVLGFWVGVQGLAGYLQGTVYTLYLLGPFLLLRVHERGGVSAVVRRWIPGLLAASILAVGILAISALPASELSRESIRKPGGLTLEEAHPVDPLQPREYLTALLDPRDTYLDPKTEVGRFYFQGFPYVGIAALFLALVSPFLGHRRKWILFFGAAAVAAGLLSLGAGTPAFVWFHHLVPTGDWFRFPRRFLAVSTLCLAILTAMTLDGFWRIATGQVRNAVRRSVSGLVLTGLFLGTGAVVLAPAGLPHSLPILVLSALLAFVLGRAEGRRRRWVVAALLGLLLTGETFWRNRNHVLHPSADPSPFTALEKGRQFLEENAGHDRVYIQRFGGTLRNHLPAKIGLIDGYQTCMDYEALTLERYERYTNLLSRGTTDLTLGFAGNRPIFLSEWTYHNSRLFDYLGVKYLAVERHTHKEQELANLPAKDGNGLLLKPAFSGDTMAVFENPNRIPRARFVTGYRVESEPRRALKALLDPALDPLETVVLEAAPPPGPWSSASRISRNKARVTLRRYEADRVCVEVVAPAAGFLVLTDQYYPGWTAEVNGKPAPDLLRADYLFRAVPLEAGESEVVFRFKPRSFHTGALASAAALILCLAMIGLGRRGKKRPAGSRK